MNIEADEGGEIVVHNIDNRFEEQETVVSRSIDLMGSLPEGAASQPGNTAVYTIIMKTKDFLLFRPSQYRLQFSINYCFEKASEFKNSAAIEDVRDLFTNTVASTLSIRASMYSVIIGSAIGGLFGALARFLQSGILTPKNIFDSIISIALSVILSVAAVIFLARKSGAQSFVSVEDLWGGMLIGFLVGYSGVSFFENLAGISSIPIQNQIGS